jgi:hypothetical protein
MKYADIPPSIEKNQLRHKIELTRDAAHIQGNCWWPGYAVTRNEGGIADLLHNKYQSTIALCPTYPWICNETPAAVTSLKHKDGKLTWSAPKIENKVSDLVKFVIYHFKDNKSIDLDDASAIICITNRYEYEVSEPGTYIVTALDRVNNESEPTKINIK